MPSDKVTQRTPTLLQEIYDLILIETNFEEFEE